MIPSLSQLSSELSSNDDVNYERCIAFREHMRSLLEQGIIVEEVERVLTEATSDNDGPTTVPDWNGFFACIALSRHAFRWGTIPVVKLVQAETVVHFPPQLDLPWKYLKSHYGITSPGGNVTSNYLCNFDEQDQIVYPINVHLSPAITEAEYHFAHVFPAIEREALPIYFHIVSCITHQYNDDRPALLDSLRAVRRDIRRPLKIYYDTMTNSKISRVIWMSHVQGFQGWAAGCIDPKSDEYVEYDGLSGNQLLFCQVIDAFLGLDSYLTPENRARYIPAAQRDFVDSVRRHSFRNWFRDSCEDEEQEVETEMKLIAKQMRVFRTAHRARVHPYLSVPAPERMIMTAGKSVLESEELPDMETAIDEFLDKMLVKRLNETR